jgi:hypothetical protein
MKLDYHGDRVIVEPRGNVRVQTQTCPRPAWRWFTGLGFDQETPHHSTFSKNRHGRFQESKVFEQLFCCSISAEKASRSLRTHWREASAQMRLSRVYP